MRLRRSLITVLGCLLLAVPTASHAANFTANVVENPINHGITWEWTPTPQHAASGETINWTWSDGHNVTKYSGDGSGFASPTSNGGSYSQVFGTGQVWFRCTLHGFLSAGGACQGMCGAYTDRTTAPGVPSFSSPMSGSTVPSTFTLSGNAEPFMLILIKQGAVVRGRAQSTSTGSWSAPVTPAPGAVTLVATANDAEGRASAGASINFTVGADTQNPTVAITEPANNEVIVSTTLFANGPVFLGTASDDSGVVSVQVDVFLPGGHQVIGPGYNFARCVSCSFPSAPGATISWSFDPVGFAPGTYTAIARAKDLVGHITSSSAVSFTYIGWPS